MSNLNLVTLVLRRILSFLQVYKKMKQKSMHPFFMKYEMVQFLLFKWLKLAWTRTQIQ